MTLGRSSAPLRLPRLSILVLVPLALSVCVSTALAAGGPKRQNVLLITVESLRTDRLGCYTGGQKTTPAIDALAEKGVRFERAYAASVSSAPSVAAALTGLYPVRHGLRSDIVGRVRDDVPTLAAVLARAGYRTGAVIGSSQLGSTHGLDRGFQVFDESIESLRTMSGSHLKERSADVVVKKGLEFLQTGKERGPFFLWLDFYDPHYDHVPPESLKKQYESDPYAGEVAHVDSQVGVLMQGLRDLGLDQTTDILFVGSHGEGLGDHGETGHGIYLFETTARVPFILVPAPVRLGGAQRPGSRPDEPARVEGGRNGTPGDGGSHGGRVVKETVGLIDVAPTVYDLAGVTPPSPLDGRSLRGDLFGEKPAPARPRRLFVEAMEPFLAYGWSPMFAVIEGDRKVVQGGRLEAFDLATDPGEAKPLQPIPAWAEGLKTFGQPLFRRAELSDVQKKRILDAAAALDLPWKNGPVCLEKNVFPDPRDRVDLNDRLFRARDGSERGLIGRGYLLSREVLETDPGNYTALELYSWLILRNATELMLIDSLEVLQCNYPLRAAAYHLYAHQMEKEKKYDKAEQAFNLFKLIEPTSDDPYYDLACLYAERDDKDRAFEYLAKAIKMGSRDFAYMRRDSRLTRIRQDARFAKLVGSAPAPTPTP